MAYPRNELFQAHCAEQSLACGFEGQNSCRSEGIGHGMGQRHRQLNRRPHPRFPRASVRILENWLSEHCQSPYPTRSDQDWLKAKTGLKRSQIANWFANARKRGKVQSSLSSRSQPKETFQSLHVFSQIAKLHPFERWLNIGPEHEAAALLDIAAAVKRANDISNERLETISGTRRYRRGSSTNWQYFHKGSSVSSMEIRSYAANIKSVHSDEWKNEGEPSAALTKAAHRRRRPATQTRGGAMEETSRTMSRKFQCTFCIECFKTKHDWQRHEKSRHIPLETWTCSPRGSVNVDPITNEITCVFCGINDPDPEHIKAHGYTRCISRPASERIFSRKDHLRQHLRLMHGDCALIASIESWRNSLNVIRSRCGFCSAVFERWDARVNHLAEHFSDGALLSEWKGDWGFDPEVLKILELATLPGKVQQRSTTREVKSPSSLNDSNYALFLELESSQFSTLLSVDDQATAFDDFEQEFACEAASESTHMLSTTDLDIYSLDEIYTSGSIYNNSANVDYAAHPLTGAFDDNLGYTILDPVNHDHCQAGYQHSCPHFEMPSPWNFAGEGANMKPLTLAKTLPENIDPTVHGFDTESLMFPQSFTEFVFSSYPPLNDRTHDQFFA